MEYKNINFNTKNMKTFKEFCLFKNNKKEEKHPDYQLMVKDEGQWIKVGAAWKKQSSKVDEKGNPTFFLSGVMNDRENWVIAEDKVEKEEDPLDTIEDPF
jgi:uncharacterized protein (DUF736 family)